jgi:hypothetical protein
MSKIKNKKSKRKKQNLIFKKPEWNDLLNITPSHCKALTDKNDKNYQNTLNTLQGFLHVYCVIKKYKPVATVEISNYKIKHYNKYSKIINKLINLANDNKVKAIINTHTVKINKKILKEREMVVFDKKYLSRAILTLYIFTTERGKSLSSAYLRGKVLGYSEKAIKEFYDDLTKYYKNHKRYYKENIKDIINSNDYKKFKQKYKKNVRNVPTLKEMNKKYLKK